jgi:L,D-transpeptidase ErfK/SrfK
VCKTATPCLTSLGISASDITTSSSPIPTRIIAKDGSYQVIAGPFKDQKEAESVAQRIKIDFEIDTKLGMVIKQ